MNVLTEIVRNVLVIIMVSSFFELLLPDGKVKPFVRFTIGLFILISVLNPTLKYLYSDKDFRIDLWTHTQSSIMQNEILETGTKINEQIFNKGDEVIKEKLEGQISAVAMLVPGVEEVDAQANLSSNGELSKLHVIVRPEVPQVEDDTGKVGVFSNRSNDYSQEEKQAIKEKLINVLMNMYGLDGTQIQVEFEGG
ncbi:MAG: stage III sporulation protein AF [Syntrophomonadaceae bacterium]|nr:stage III sporulation protein AF [Syntrophomonadaceae bacterium]